LKKRKANPNACFLTFRSNDTFTTADLLKMMKLALAFLLAGTAAAFAPAAPSKGSTALNVARTKKVTGEVRKRRRSHTGYGVVFLHSPLFFLSCYSLPMVFQDLFLPLGTLILLD
jgi:hypothetical protein